VHEIEITVVDDDWFAKGYHLFNHFIKHFVHGWTAVETWNILLLLLRSTFLENEFGPADHVFMIEGEEKRLMRIQFFNFIFKG
jgi:hypothetical protein